MGTRVAVCNVAVGRGWYHLGQQRLLRSLHTYAPGVDPLMWDGRYPKGSPTQEVSHKAFKLWSILEARDRGYDVAIWADASVFFIRNIKPLIARIERDGYWWCEDGHYVGQWTTDRQLEILGYTRDEAMKILHVMGALWGFDLRSDNGKAIVQYMYDHRAAFGNEWDTPGLYDGYARGSDDPRVKGHRHDNVILGAASHRLGIPREKHPCFLSIQYYDNVPKAPPVVLAIAHGM